MPTAAIPFDDSDIRYRATMWTLMTERSTKSMTKRMQRTKTLFGPDMMNTRRELHLNEAVRARAEGIAAAIALPAGESMDRRFHTRFWAAWHRSLIGVVDGDVYVKDFAETHFERDAKGVPMDLNTLVHGILNFAHLWCDEITENGYLDFLQSMESAIAGQLEEAPCRSNVTSPIMSSSAGASPQRALFNVAPSEESRRGSDTMQRLLDQTGADAVAVAASRTTPTHSTASTPGCMPLARGMRVAWVQGEDYSPLQFRRPAALCERYFTPNAMARRSSATQSELGDSVGRLDTEAQLKLWSPDVPRGSAVNDRANDSLLDDDPQQHSFAGNTSPWSLAAALNQSHVERNHRESAPISIGYSAPLATHHSVSSNHHPGSAHKFPTGSPLFPGTAPPSVDVGPATSTAMPPPIFVLPGSPPPYSERPLDDGGSQQHASSSHSSASRPHTSVDLSGRLGTSSHRSSPSIGNVTPTHPHSVSPRALTVLRRTPQQSGHGLRGSSSTPNLMLPAIRRNDIYSLPKPIG